MLKTTKIIRGIKQFLLLMDLTFKWHFSKAEYKKKISPTNMLIVSPSAK